MASEKLIERTRGSAQSDWDVERDRQPATLDCCRRCALWRDATQAVPGEGPRHAAIMLVGEQPRDSEDVQGRPFVGPAGAPLGKALERQDWSAKTSMSRTQSNISSGRRVASAACRARKARAATMAARLDASPRQPLQQRDVAAARSTYDQAAVTEARRSRASSSGARACRLFRCRLRSLFHAGARRSRSGKAR
jgi:Uracil DNA glycosylase superfamily